MASSNSLKEYLKKYESNDNVDKKKKKKKKPKTVTNGVVVLDEDPVWQKPVNLDEEEEEDEPGVEPQVDEDINLKYIKRLELLKAKGSHNRVSEDGSGWVSVSETPNQSTPLNVNSDISPPRRRKARFDTPSPEAVRNPPDSGGDLSPPRQNRRRNDSPSPSPPVRRENSDLSPPRQRRRVGDSPSPQRMSKTMKGNVEDLSPPRKHGRRYDSPSPEPMGKASDSGYNSDLSPPRKRGQSQSFPSPSRSRRQTQVSPSLAISRKGSSSVAKDLSPPRRAQGEDLSPPRKSNKEKKTGLITGKDVSEEIAKIKKDEWSRFNEMDASASGRGAEPVYRIKGKRVSKDEYVKLTKKQEKPKEEKKLEWGKGLAQKREAEAKVQELELEKSKPFARSRDDPELDNMMKDRLRWGDPMAHLVKRKQSDIVLPDFGDTERMKESGFIVPQEIPSHSWLKRGLDFEPNRYGIKPGRHWDGVNRSTGYEKQLFKRTNEKRATEREAYLWSVSDM